MMPTILPARFLLLLLMPWMAHTNHAQAPPPAIGLGGMVDKFTGDLSYSLPLLTVPGPNGEAFPIAIQYQGGGIGVDQAASEIGLGWSMPIGEIVRNVNGHPDDLKAAPYERALLPEGLAPVTQEDLRLYGPVHFRSLPGISDATMLANCTVCSAMDLYSTRAGRSGQETTFEFPDYDDYSAIGPALSAKLEMHLFDFSSIFQKPLISSKNDLGATSTFTHRFDSEYERASRKPTLLINEAKTLNVVAPFSRGYRAWTGETTTEEIPYTTDIGNGVSQGDDLILTDTDSRPKNGYYVNYFTNAEIHAHYNGGTAIADFMDQAVEGQYPARNSTTHFEQDGIGAIQVTDPNGFTYHYSLPVYTHSETRYVFDLLYDDDAGYTFPEDPDNIPGFKVERFTKDYRHASTWKLSAITGPDFVDVNENAIPDDEDEGYWVRLSYGKWAAHFPIRYPIFGFQADLSGEENGGYDGPLSYGNEPYRKTGTSLRMDNEVYYLNAIATSTHTAYFIHDVRFDEHSIETDPKPKLKLAEIILIRNEDLPSNAFSDAIQPDEGPFEEHAETGVGVGNVYNTAQVDADGLRAISLASVVLEQDYSLARKLHNNIQSATSGDFNDDPFTFGDENDVLFYEAPSGIEPDDLGSSGKLTLKGLRILHDGAEQTMPGYAFRYFDELSIGEVTDPLDYDPDLKDHFGHFKYDYDDLAGGAYTTQRSAAFVHAWSLSSILDPLGARINIEYEPDQYELVGYGNELPVPPSRYYFIKNIEGSAHTGTKVVALYDPDGPYELDNSLNNSRIRDVSMTYKVYCDDVPTYSSYSFQNLHGSLASGNEITLQRTDADQFGSCTNFQTAELGNDEKDFVCIRYRYQYGGGVRVKQLTLTNSDLGQPYVLGLRYQRGICTAEPDPYDTDMPFQRRDGVFPMNMMRTVLMDRAAGDRHAPPSVVGYTVTTEEVLDADGSMAGGTEHEFINYIEPYRSRYSRTHNSSFVNIHEAIECTVGGSTYGQPSSVTVLDKNGTALSQTIYRYETQPSSAIEEAFTRIGTPSNFVPYWVSDLAQAWFHTLFVKKQTYRRLSAIEHHENSAILVTTFDNIDHNTGEPLLSKLEQDRTGERTNEQVAAYTEHDALGPKWEDAANKNILTPAISVSSSTGTASQNDWSDEHAVRRFDAAEGKYITEVLTTQWAPTRSYTKSGTGVDDWKYLGMPTLYSPRMQALEQKDMKDGYAATRLTLSGERTLAQASNCNYASFTFCSFEGELDNGEPLDPSIWYDGEVTSSGVSGVALTTEPGIVPHGGEFSVTVEGHSAGPYFHVKPSTRTDAGETVETGLLTGHTYRAIAWVHTSSPNDAQLSATLIGSDNIIVGMGKSSAQAITVGDWVRLEVRIPVPSDFTISSEDEGLTVRLTNSHGSTPAYFDDLLVYPVDGGISGAIWDERRGLLKESIGQEGFLTRQTHDAAGNVTMVEQETENGMRVVQRSEVAYQRTF